LEQKIQVIGKLK